MRILLLALLVLGSFSSFAKDNCTDKNLNGIKIGETYNQLQYHKRFKLLFESDSPAPAGFSDYFGSGSELCHDVKATYLKHNPSGKTYVMFTTHDDYCDGGNTTGIMIDMVLYGKHKLEDAIVGDIGDSEFYCR